MREVRFIGRSVKLAGFAALALQIAGPDAAQAEMRRIEEAASAPSVTLPARSFNYAKVIKASLPAVAKIDVKGKDWERIGSGVSVDPRGYVVTDTHVINPNFDPADPRVSGPAESVSVDLNGKTYRARVVAIAKNFDTDPDLALLKIPGHEHRFLKLASANAIVRVGDPVVALGAPWGERDTATQGVIIDTRDPLFLQADAATKPGSSGGALLGIGGEVLGINVRDHRFTRESDGVRDEAFIPANIVQKFLADNLPGYHRAPETSSLLSDDQSIAAGGLPERMIDNLKRTQVEVLVPAGAAGVAGNYHPGTIIDPSGYILTSRLPASLHTANVAFLEAVADEKGPSRREVTGRILGSDEATGIALLKIDIDRPLSFVSLSNSAAPQLGDPIMFVSQAGSSRGVVSHLERNELFTDAPIYQNFGAGFFDTHGMFLGVATGDPVSKLGEQNLVTVATVSALRQALERLGQGTLAGESYLPARDGVVPKAAHADTCVGWNESLGPAIAAAAPLSVTVVDELEVNGEWQVRKISNGIVASSDGMVIADIPNLESTSPSRRRVDLPSGQSMDAEPIITDPRLGLGIFKIPASGLPAAKSNRRGTPQAGARVFTLGTQYDRNGMVTSGIVSRLVDGRYVQTDAFLQNKGPGGNGLFDGCGKLVGIFGNVGNDHIQANGLHYAFNLRTIEKMEKEARAKLGPTREIRPHPQPNTAMALR